MSAFRRRLFAFTWAVLSTQALVLGLGTARVCADGPHMHGGVAVIDCAMHHGAKHPHHSATSTAESAANAHHSHAGATDVGDPIGPQMRCRCTNDAPPTYIGQIAIVEPAHVTARPVEVATLLLIADDSALLQRYSPPSPPPR